MKAETRKTRYLLNRGIAAARPFLAARVSSANLEGKGKEAFGEKTSRVGYWRIAGGGLMSDLSRRYRLQQDLVEHSGEDGLEAGIRGSRDWSEDRQRYRSWQHTHLEVALPTTTSDRTVYTITIAKSEKEGQRGEKNRERQRMDGSLLSRPRERCSYPAPRKIL